MISRVRMAKQIIVKAFNSVLRPLGAEIVRSGRTTPVQTLSAPRHDPSSRYMQTNGLRELLVDELVQVARNFFAERIPDVAPKSFDFRGEVENFLNVYCQREHQDNVGGSGFHNSFWIFLTVRALNPELIVESGVWKGHTTHCSGRLVPMRPFTASTSI